MFLILYLKKDGQQRIIPKILKDTDVFPLLSSLVSSMSDGDRRVIKVEGFCTG